MMEGKTDGQRHKKTEGWKAVKKMYPMYTSDNTTVLLLSRT